MAFAIKNSSTLILPRWYALLDELKLGERIMPRDVSTRWNSTYDMLKFALNYRVALDAISGERDMKLQKYELKDTEWHIASQLRDILEVSSNLKLFDCLMTFFLALKRCHPFFFPSNTQHRDRYPCHGPSGSTSRYKCPQFRTTSFHPCSHHLRQAHSQ